MIKYLVLIFGLMVPVLTYSENKLLIPDKIEGTEFNLVLQKGIHNFYEGIETNTLGANGNILGPTLIFNAGDSVNISVKNNIGDSTTIHWHGLHVSAKNDGGPHTIIPPGMTWYPSFKVLDKAATYWYHPHLHEKTNEHVTKGIAGLIIVKDEEEAGFDLPRDYGIDDFPIIVQTKTFDNEGQILVPHNADSVVMLNATIDPYLDVPAQIVRFRLLNGASQRTFVFGFSDSRTFSQIATDGGLRSETFVTNELQLAPGERSEILFDFSGMDGEEINMMSYGKRIRHGTYGSIRPGMGNGMNLNDYNPNRLNGENFNILSIRVKSPTENPVTEMPHKLAAVEILKEEDAIVTRTLSMRPTKNGFDALNNPFTFNGEPFDMQKINQEIKLGDTEIWELVNNSPMAHPFHIHDVQFNILDRNGAATFERENGRKDVVIVHQVETVRIIMKFEDFADDDVPYMYHCHMLTHEDDGMMGQFLVKNSLSSPEENEVDLFYIYQDNDRHILKLNKKNTDITLSNCNISIFNILGDKIYDKQLENKESALVLENLETGIYFAVLNNNDKIYRKKFNVLY